MKHPTRYLVDSSILLRFLSGEPAGQAAAAKKLFAQAGAGKIVLDLSPVIVAEALYTLVSLYGVERKAAAENLAVLLQQRGVKLRDAGQVLSALERFRAVDACFSDAYLAADDAEERAPVASFDQVFDQFKDVTRYEPKG